MTILTGTGAGQQRLITSNTSNQIAVNPSCGSGQDPSEKQECTGQLHHIISMKVWRALNDHHILRGQYSYRDPRFISRAKDLKAHCGWEHWHREIDDEIVVWLKKFDQATARQFEAYLRQVYARTELRLRFPNGI